MDLKEIQELIKLLNKSNISEIRIERDNFKIMIRTQDQNGPVQYVRQEVVNAPQAPAVVPVAPVAAPKEITSAPVADAAPEKPGQIVIKSPMIGTFYRSSSPDKPSFVNVGDEIKPGTVLCIVEAMKLFNEIESEYTGRIVKVLLENAKPVEYDQPLFLIEPL
ncbi:MAG: acetyl-CoA carboxylase biotin carboxyl carrier protein [Chitinophagales bacterium]|nr:acetyl-CoA carboxylase biotin carboxyl carrier protein [Chitinophagales bacterium]